MIEHVSDDRADVIRLDTTGTACPIPVIELAKAMRAAEVGAVVELVSDDAAAKVDIPIWCRMQSQTLRSQRDDDGVWTFEIEKTTD